MELSSLYQPLRGRRCTAGTAPPLLYSSARLCPFGLHDGSNGHLHLGNTLCVLAFVGASMGTLPGRWGK